MRFLPDFDTHLAKTLLSQLFRKGWLPLLGLMMVFVSAISVVLVTHKTRVAIHEKEQALSERERLDSEWRNLLLEEMALSEHSRVQDTAQQEMQMQRPEPDKEVVILLE